MRYQQRKVKVGQCLKVDYFGHPEEIDAEIELECEGTAGAKRRFHFIHSDPDYDGPDVSVDVPETVTVTLDDATKVYLKETYPEVEPPDTITVPVTPDLRKELAKQGEEAFFSEMEADRAFAEESKAEAEYDRRREEGY